MKYQKIKNLMNVILENASDGFLIMDKTGNIIVCNKSFSEMIEYSQSEITQMNIDFIDDIYKITQKELFINFDKNTFQATFEHKFETNFKSKTNKRINAEINCNLLQEENDELFYCLFIRNITKRIQLREALRESEERYKAISEYSKDAICIIDENAKFIWMNEALIKMGGYTKEEYLNAQSFAHFLAPESIEWVINNFYKMLQKQEYIHFYEFYFVNSKGEKRLCEKYMTDYIDKNGKLNLIVSMRDITERKEEENALRKAKEQAEEASKIKSDFLSNMSHELRTPLNGIMGFTEILAETETDTEKKEMLYLIKTSNESLLKLIDNILNISNIESGKIKMNEISFSLESFFIDVNNYYKTKINNNQNSNIEYLSSNDCILEEVIGDFEKIKQITIQLIENAFKFTKKGYISFEIIKKQKTKTNLLINFIIKDTGIGISEEKQKKLFEKFEQGEYYLNKKHCGTGLGLAIVNDLVKLLKGNLTYETELNKGTKFIIEIPLKLQ